MVKTGLLKAPPFLHTVQDIIMLTLKGLKKMNDLPIIGEFRLKILPNSLSSAKTWPPCLVYTIPFKNYFAVDWKLIYILKLAKTLPAELISSSDSWGFHCQEPHGRLLLRALSGSFRNWTRQPLRYHF